MQKGSIYIFNQLALRTVSLSPIEFQYAIWKWGSCCSDVFRILISRFYVITLYMFRVITAITVF